MHYPKTNHLILLFILVIGTILRLYNWQEIPFTHDEYSALFRIGFPDFDALIEKGVKPDGHPAGIQVFLFYWTALVGTSTPILVKLPFICSGIASIYLVYRIGTFWFNETVGLACAAFLASLQYPVLYSQLIRPYSSGLCFTLLAVWFWSLYLWEKTGYWKYWAGWVLGATLCLYNHYFSFLVVGIVGISGLFMLKPKKLKPYLLSGLVIGFAYLPHWPIFFHQLTNNKGLHWLGTPGWNFPWQYLQYCFQYNLWNLSMFLGLGLAGILFNHSLRTEPLFSFNNKKRSLLLIWFLLPLLIGLVYSILVQPVLQYRVLIFSFPFLLLLVLSPLPPLKNFRNAGLIILILGINIVVLTVHRNHYHLIYKDGYETTFKSAKTALETHGKNQIHFYLACTPKIANHWLEKLDLPKDQFTLIDTMNLKAFWQSLSKSREKHLGMGWPGGMKWEFYEATLDYYSYLRQRVEYHSGSFCLFSKNPSTDTPSPYFRSYYLNFENASRYHSDKPSPISNKHSLKGTSSFHFNKNKQYGPVLKARLDTILHNTNDVLTACGYMLRPDTVETPLLTIKLSTEKGKTLKWDAGKPVLKNSDTTPWLKGVRSLHLANHDFDPAETFITVSVWNRHRDDFYLDNLGLKVMKGNLTYYGLTYPLGEQVSDF